MDAARFVDATLRLGHDALGASRVAFYRVDRQQDLHDFTCSGVPGAFHRLYVDEMVSLDPLHARRISGGARDIVSLRDATAYAPTEDVTEYRRFLRSFGCVDVLEMLFRDGLHVVAGLCMMWTARDRPLTQERCVLGGVLQQYIQFNLPPGDTALRAARREYALRTLQLSARQFEVAELLCMGQSNAEIARCLQLSMATVKTHVLHIYQKCEVRNRAELAQRMTAGMGVS